jgi:putative phage-type endonuclease
MIQICIALNMMQICIAKENMLTKEDLEYRRNKIGASDSSAIMGVNPWETPLMLWERKLGLRNYPEINRAMQKGNDLEDFAREQFTQLTGIRVKPRRIEHPTIPYSFATLDGISDCGNVTVEIKVPWDLKSGVIIKAKRNEIQDYHYPQLQKQWDVVRPKEHYYFVWNDYEKKGYLIEVKPNKAYIDELLRKEAEFYKCMMDFCPPEATFKDYQHRHDEEWVTCAENFLLAKKCATQYEEEVEACRKKLIELAGGLNSMGGGVTLSKGLRRGSIPYASIPEVKSLDLEKHRKPPTEYWRLN